MIESTLSEGSCLFDAGHGLGIPFYILHNRSLINNFIGCEICPLKAWKSTEMRRILEPFFIKIGKPLSLVSIKLLCCSVECLANLDTGLEPTTHVYAAWEGWSPTSMEALGTLFSRTTSAMYLVLVQKGNREGCQNMPAHLKGLGFGELQQNGSPISV